VALKQIISTYQEDGFKAMDVLAGYQV